MLPLRDVNPTSIRPVVTWAVIAVNVVIFFFVQPSGDEARNEFDYHYAAISCELTTGAPLDFAEVQTGRCTDLHHSPAVFPDKNIWLSVGISMFLHGGLAHLLFNMWSLWIFGNNVEEALGGLGYLIFYLAAGVAATAGFVFTNPGLTVPLVGASGAIAGVMGAYVVLFPRHRIITLVFFFVTAIPAVVFLGIWFFAQFALGDQAEGVAWQAHVAGFLFGALLAALFRRRLLANVAAAPPAPVGPYTGRS